MNDREAADLAKDANRIAAAMVEQGGGNLELFRLGAMVALICRPKDAGDGLDDLADWLATGKKGVRTT